MGTCTVLCVGATSLQPSGLRPTGVAYSGGVHTAPRCDGSESGGDTAFCIICQNYMSPFLHFTLQWTRNLSGVRWGVKYNVEFAPCIVPTYVCEVCNGELRTDVLAAQ